jgi:DNA (cytosine-5)-methyltransferase 1
VTAVELRDAARAGRLRHGHTGEWDSDIDLVVGGPPCQGFSLIGKRIVDDPRNELVFHFFRIVKEIRPRYFVMENVPGMRIGGHSSILDRLIADFEAEGYAIRKPVEILNAAEYGVPQLRRRLFVLGARHGEKLPAYPAPTSTVNAKSLIAERPYAPSVGDAILDLPNLDAYASLMWTDEVDLRETAWKAPRSDYARHLRGIERDPADLAHPRRWRHTLLTSSMRTEHTNLSIRRFTKTKPGTVEPVSRFLRLDPSGLCNTLRAGTGSERGAYTSPRPVHPKYPRVISVREAARLHSFPDWFRLHRTKWHGFRQVGNAVAPLVGRAVGAEIAKALAVSPPIPTNVRVLGSPDLLDLTMVEATQHFGVAREAVPAPRRRLVRST